MATVFEIQGAAQSYDWGTLGKDGSKVAQFAKPLPGFKYDENKPYAEVRAANSSRIQRQDI
jgi:mannose-6-phosphate isomerase